MFIGFSILISDTSLLKLNKYTINPVTIELIKKFLKYSNLDFGTFVIFESNLQNKINNIPDINPDINGLVKNNNIICYKRIKKIFLSRINQIQHH